MFGVRLPSHVFFSYSTAALLLGAPLPWRLESDPLIHASVPAPHPAPHATGLVGHSIAVAPEDVVTSGWLRLTSASRTWCDLAATLSLADLVAVGDFLIHWRAPLTTLPALQAQVDAMGAGRGIRTARTAIGLLSDRPESRPESRLRLIVLRSGLPEPRINHALVDTETGKQVRPDFQFPAYKLILEYQGDYHRTREQWREDMTRRARLEALGWYVMELNADDLDDPVELIQRIQTVLSRRP